MILTEQRERKRFPFMDSTLNNKTSHKIPKYVYSLCVLHKNLWDVFYHNSSMHHHAIFPIVHVCCRLNSKNIYKKNLTLHDQSTGPICIHRFWAKYYSILSFLLICSHKHILVDSFVFFGSSHLRFNALYVECIFLSLFRNKIKKKKHFQEDQIIFKNFKNIKKSYKIWNLQWCDIYEIWSSTK